MWRILLPLQEWFTLHDILSVSEVSKVIFVLECIDLLRVSLLYFVLAWSGTHCKVSFLPVILNFTTHVATIKWRKKMLRQFSNTQQLIMHRKCVKIICLTPTRYFCCKFYIMKNWLTSTSYTMCQQIPLLKQLHWILVFNTGQVSFEIIQ